MLLKKTVAVLLLVAVLFTGVCYIVFIRIVPAGASLAIPRKWKTISLGEPEKLVHDYLGQPHLRGGYGDTKITEAWYSGTKKKEYSLRLYFNKDTILTDYAIRYHYRGLLLKKTYLLDSATFR